MNYIQLGKYYYWLCHKTCLWLLQLLNDVCLGSWSYLNFIFSEFCAEVVQHKKPNTLRSVNTLTTIYQCVFNNDVTK